jgi:hypothetical protein
MPLLPALSRLARREFVFVARVLVLAAGTPVFATPVLARAPGRRPIVVLL